MIAFIYSNFTSRRPRLPGPRPARAGAGRAIGAALSRTSLPAVIAPAALALALAAAGRAEARQGSWQRAPPMPTPRRLLAAAALDGKAYALGGCGSACFEPPLQTSAFEETRVEVYDPVANSWTARNPMPTILFGAAAVAPGNGKIYTLGGVLSGNVVQEYDPAADSWTLRRPMPTPRYGLAVVALDGKLYALGGSGPSNAMEVYDPATDTWSSRAPLPTARIFLAAAVAGGKVYAIGGSPDCCGGSQTDVVEVYDPATDRWGTAAPLPVALQVSAAAGIGGLIYTFGGFIPGAGVQSTTLQYTPASDSWAEQAPMPTPRDQAPAVVLPGAGANVLGGAIHCHCQALAENERFTPNELVADLTVELTPRGALDACTPVQLQIGVANHGPDAAAGTLVEDRFPPELTAITWTCEGFGGARCEAASGGGNIEEQVDLPPGGSVTYEVSARLAASASGSLADTATISPPPGVVDPRPEDDTSTIAEPIAAAAADLDLRSVAPPALTAGGATAPYLVAVTNRGPCVAEDTVLVLTLAAGLELLSPLPGGCTAGGPGNQASLTCRLGSMDPRREAQLSATVAAPCDQPAGPAVSLARATSATRDPFLGNNSQTGETQVAVVADYAIVKTVSCIPPVPAPDAIPEAGGCTQAAVGENLRYQLVVTNHGPSCPPGVTVADAFAPALTGTLWCAGAGCNPSRTGDLHAVVDLAPLASATFLATAGISPAFCGTSAPGVAPASCDLLPISPPTCLCGTVSNTASVLMPPGVLDPHPRNNASTVSTAALLVLAAPP